MFIVLNNIQHFFEKRLGVMQAIWLMVFGVTFSLLYQPVVLADPYYRDSLFVNCREKIISGETITVPCKPVRLTMTPVKIEESLEQFREFERSDIVDEVFKAAEERDVLSRSEQWSFTRKGFHDPEYEAQELVRQKSLKSLMSFRSKLKPDVAEKIFSIKNDRYFVRLVFINDSDFPYKYTDEEVFKENTTEAYMNDWKKIIFEHYLSENYAQYSPTLGAVHKSVVIHLLVDSSDQLESIVEKQPVKSMSHIGKPPLPADEPVTMPVTPIYRSQE